MRNTKLRVRQLRSAIEGFSDDWYVEVAEPCCSSLSILDEEGHYRGLIEIDWDNQLNIERYDPNEDQDILRE